MLKNRVCLSCGDYASPDNWRTCFILFYFITNKRAALRTTKRDRPLFVLFRRKEDMKVVRVFIDVEEDGLRVTSVVADALDGRCVEMPAVEPPIVILLILMVQRDCRLNSILSSLTYTNVV